MKQEEAEGAALVASPGRPGEPLLALSSVPQLLVHGGGDGGDLLLEQKKSHLRLEIDLLEKHQ